MAIYSNRSYKAICNVFEDIESFVSEYKNNNGKDYFDRNKPTLNDFGEKLWKAETYFYKYNSDGNEKTRSEDEQEEYEKAMSCYFEEEIIYLIKDYETIVKGSDKMKIERIYFTETELGEELYHAYINMSPVFFQDSEGVYYYAECVKSDKHRIGTLEKAKELIRAWS